MECKNPSCKKKVKDVVKFDEVENNQELLSSTKCPDCGSLLPRSAIERSQYETEGSKASKQEELESARQKNEKKLEVTDEELTARSIDSQHEQDLTCSSTSDQGLEALSLNTSNQEKVKNHHQQGSDRECVTDREDNSPSQDQAEENDDKSESDSEEGTKPPEQKTGPDQQQQQQTTVEAPRPCVFNPTDEDCVTIIFHALLSPNFNFNKKKHKIGIRAGHPELGSFEWNCVDIEPRKHNASKPSPTFFKTASNEKKGKFLYVWGKMQLPLRLVREEIPYKYVVCSTKKKQVAWEYLEFADNFPKATFVNRSLVLPDAEKDAVLHKYDGVIYPNPYESNSKLKILKWWGKNGFNQDEVLKNRRTAAKTFFPSWKGFFILNPAECEQMPATKVLEQVHVISECLSKVYLSVGDGTRNVTVHDLKFDEILKPKLEHNANLSKKKLESFEVRVDRLVSSLAITHLIAHYKLDLTYKQLQNILNCLVIQANGYGRCDFDGIHDDFPEEMWSDLVNSILHLMKDAHEKHDNGFCPDAIFAVPLVHFLRKDTKPFEEPEVTHPKTAQEWCCAKNFIHYNKIYPEFVKSFLPKALPMFTLDPLLRRLFLHYTPIEDFPLLSTYDKQFPMHEICTALFYKVRNSNFRSENSSQNILKTLSNLMERDPAKQREERCRLEQSKALHFAKSSMLLLKELNKNFEIKDTGVLLNGFQFAIHVLCGSLDEDQGQVTYDDIEKQCQGILLKIAGMVEAEVKKEYPMMSSHKESRMNEVKIWSALLKLRVSWKNSLENNWIYKLACLFEERLKKVNDEDIVDLYCEVAKDEQFHQDLVESITKQTFVAVERIVEKGGRYESLISTLQEKSLQRSGLLKAGELLSRIITCAWNKAMANKNLTDHHDVLQYALTWKPWTNLLSIHEGSQEKERILTHDANEYVKRVADCLVTVQDALADGSIDIRSLTLLIKYGDDFKQLCRSLYENQTKLKEHQNQPSLEDMELNLERRIEEYDLFFTTKEDVERFIDICKSLRHVDLDIEDLKLKANYDVSAEKMTILCRRVLSSEELAKERVEVVFFDCLPNGFHSILPLMLKAYESKTFQAIWESNCKAVLGEKKDKELTLVDVQDKVWPASIEELTRVADTVYIGSILLKDVHTYFSKIASEKDLKDELDVMFQLTLKEIYIPLDPTCIVKRVDQITQYRILQNRTEVAETVWKFKEVFGLSGDFSAIKDLRKQASEEFSHKDLKSIDDSLTKACEYLTELSLAENSQCLDAVIECQPLVTWLQATIKDTSSLSTLVDLAMISAGENDLEVDRVSNLHTSCLSFAPLIFDLNKNSGFEDLMKACKPVWKASNQDRNLSRKLAETCRQIEWLKAVQSFYGSVEMSSIKQVKAINSSGVISVGHVAQDHKKSTFMSSGKKDLENVLTLTVPVDPRPQDSRQRQDGEVKTYTLNDLKDLQSKLMLIAGKTAQLQKKDGIESTEEINRFVKVLEGVMRLGKIYIDLCEAGDVKYLDWSKEVHCSDDSFLPQRSVAEELAITSHEMEKRLENWRSHVHEKRHQYKQLNHYTTKQILVMRRELGLLREEASAGDKIPLQVYTLLESVRPNITSQDINQVFETLDFGGDDQRIAMSSTNKQQGNFRSANLREKYQSFLHTVEKMGFDEKVAIAALKANDVAKQCGMNENDLITWCMDNGEDEDIVFEWCEKAREDEDYFDFFPDHWPQNDKEQQEQGTELEENFFGNPDHVNGEQAEDLTEDYLQDDFEQRPYLTIDELGCVLNELSFKCKKIEARRYPVYLNQTKPNLLLMPKEDILPTVLTLYGGNSLPTANEVLVCTHETTAEEIELFWWRAFGDTNQQIFCLIHPDILDYNISQTAVHMLDILKQEFTGTAEGCKVIILCSTENEDRSHIIAALDEYRLNVVPRRDSPDVLSRYLAKQFTCPTSLGYLNDKWVSWIPAGSVDSDSLSVRIVCSDRAGAGKSLMITRLFEQVSNLKNNIEVTKMKKLPLTVTVPLHGTVAHTGSLLDGLWKYPVRGDLPVSRVVHLDVSPSVTEGVETLLFNLLVLGVLYDNSGRLWRRKPTDLYVIEMTNPMSRASDKRNGISFLSLLPMTNCITPRETLKILKTNHPTESPLFDDQEYRSNAVQRSCHYLKVRDDDQEHRSNAEHRARYYLGAQDDDHEHRSNAIQRARHFLKVFDVDQEHRSYAEHRARHYLKVRDDDQEHRSNAVHRARHYLKVRDDDHEHRSNAIQRARHYLKSDDVRQSLDRLHFVPGNLEGSQAKCLALIIKYCGIEDPSWSELNHFVSFLNAQLEDCEKNPFCKPENVDDSWMQGTLAGFTSFVIRFMVTMSRDFATPSLDDNLIACSSRLPEEENDDEDIRPLQLRRRWESSTHPYIFFNQDHITMTFLGFHINTDGDLIDPDTNANIQHAVMTKELRNGLKLQKVDFEANYSAWTKQERINKLCSVMGVKDNKVDPDPSYELTIDNMKKILAIHMKFRCGIPVIIMGETGCGKTRLIRYMCALQAGPRGQQNMLLMKMHGGTSYEDIIKKVEHAEKMAAENEKKDIDTVVFFDETNTTNALGMIKEVMVDRRINGRPVGVGLRRLHFIAACNPYRRHTDNMIKKLESAGLGYSVKSEETKDKLGRIPLRHLVYRVHALPASMRPLVWDFGQLKPEIEKLYIRQIVGSYVFDNEQSFSGNETHVEAISDVLAAAQKHMRQQQDECSFVSLRDIKRTMTVMTWFYQHYAHFRPQVTHGQDEDIDEEGGKNKEKPIDKITWSLVMSLGVCYQAKLQDREAFRKVVTSAFTYPLNIKGGQEQMHLEILRCQEVMINELSLGPNIARNTALSENVFMMVVCIELRIPLFVIGKPGSSKSLAKTVVADNMQGDASKSQLFRTFKRAHMVSYQCSPQSTPDGIVATFRQCRRLQESNPDDRYASVVVLDEVGLAEDSPLMPLKTLHPLLEYGVTSSDDVIETDEKPTRVAFIGISNWALDPAKMNRGLMLMRGEPSIKELEDSAWGICAETKNVGQHLSTLLEQLAAGYADLYAKQKTFESLRTSKRDEFFGLRDFYSLIKMVNSIAAEKNDKPTWPELHHAIRRNFSGLDEIDAVEIFREHISGAKTEKSEPVNTLDLLQACLDHENTMRGNRYLLVLTENYSALSIVEQELIKIGDSDYVVIFGSSFSKDQEYTQVCRNINQIKVCMETGRTVVLLNLEKLYESLYDALNQYYIYCAGQKYVDLGLGSHRVKCRVHDNFRLIVIAEKNVVYEKFPIPLINRLEKHYLVTSKSLGPAQLDLANDLKNWAKNCAKVHRQRHEIRQNFAIGDAFIGYQSDTVPAMVYQTCSESTCYANRSSSEEWLPEVKERCQKLLLQCATPDAMARLPYTGLSGQAKDLWDIYFKQQEHTSLPACLKQLLGQTERRQTGLMLQVSTHSRLLSENDLADVSQATHFMHRDIKLLMLQQFQTEQQFLQQVREFFISLSSDEGILLVQCDSGDEKFNLIACTRHLLMDQRTKRAEMLKEKLKIEVVPPVHIVVIIQLPRVKGGCVNFVGFHGGQWDSFHVDDLHPPTKQLPPIQMLSDRPISELLNPAEPPSQETFEGQDRMDTNLNRFDPMALLRRSVQAAAGRLEDDPVMVNRAIHRIDLLLSLLPEDSSKIPDGPSFAKLLHRKIYYLLVEKNEKQSGDLARQWICHEALSGTNIHERGTFRRALQHKVMTEVEPLLAKVFAYADRDCNLDLLRDQEPWILRLWISIFDNERLSKINYEISSSTIGEHVQVSGKGGHVFSCRLPFSWLVKEMIDDLWRGIPHGSSGSSEREEDTLRGIMENSDLSYILSVIQKEGKGDEAARRYLHDFVHMIYKPNKETNDEEIELVMRAVITAAEKRSKEEHRLDFPGIHVAFSCIQSRLNNFNLLVQAEPGLTSLLLEPSDRQLTIDVAGLIECLKKLQPTRDDLETSEKRNDWCRRVLNIRKSIEAMTSSKVFSKKPREIDDYEEGEKNLLRKCWEMWQRLSVIRLFVDHVCNVAQQTNAEDIDTNNVFKLWEILGDDTNFLKAPCIRRLESFLVECNEEHRKSNNCFETTCIICLGRANKPSVIPCGHYCCLECASRWFSENSSCPNCREPVPADYTPTESEHIREEQRKYMTNVSAFKNQCDSFFMEVVSLFCFGYSPCGTLETDAFDLLMGYVVTGKFSPFRDQDKVDVNPVVRSFLLQRLLKSSNQKVKEYMDVFIKRPQDVVRTDAASSVEVFVLCIQCMEDDRNNEFIKRASELSFYEKLSQLKRYFHAATALFCKEREDEALSGIMWLEGIANTRFVLTKAADFLHQSHNGTGNEARPEPNVIEILKSLIFKVEKICVQKLFKTPRLFLLKQLSRNFGCDAINVLAEQFEWLLPPELKELSKLTPDWFLVYGMEYQRLRETISKVLIESGDVDSIQEVFQNMTSCALVSNVALLLGIYQEVTTTQFDIQNETTQSLENFLSSSEHLFNQTMQSLENFLSSSEHLFNQSRVLARDLVNTKKEGGNIKDVLKIAGDTPWDKRMVEIIIHLAAVLFSRDKDDLIGPLLSLALRPSITTDSFLPTMPDDPLQEVRSAGIGKLYECPNGHPYVITECGKPMKKSRCRARGCGAEIGGIYHRLTKNNRAARTTNLSQKGHCLGSPDDRETEPIPERKMPVLNTCLLRLLVHGSMLIGSCYHRQDVHQIISPSIPEESVLEFLWKHAMRDMNLLSKVSGRSVDDTALMVHLILHNISEHALREGHSDTLNTKEQRNEWENNFSAELVAPVMANLEISIQNTMKLIADDKRFGPLLRQLWELDSEIDATSEIQPNCMALWRYRAPVTLDHVTRAFNESTDAQDEGCVVLSEFLKEERKLRAVRFLPDVVKLQKLLMNLYHRTPDKTETDKLIWKVFEKRVPKGAVQEYRDLRKSFRLAWNIMVTTRAEQDARDETVIKLSQYTVGDNSSMSMFIPATSGLGAYSLTLLQFLVNAHNELMELYKRKSANTPLQVVSVTEVTSSQLVSYDADRDLLPLMQAHCHYSFEVGRGTVAKYEWTAIQKKLIDRLVRGRVFIDLKEGEYMKTTEVSAESVLTTLTTKVPQVEISGAIQGEITRHYRSLDDVCEALSSLNIAISFLASGGGKPKMLISEYIHQVLKLPKDRGLRNIQAQKACQIQQLVSLWRLLSFQRAKMLTKQNQDPFEHLSSDFKVKPSEAVEVSLNKALRKMGKECLNMLVFVSLEIIILRLNDRSELNLDVSLKDYIMCHLDDKDADPIPEVENIPNKMLLKHIVRFWQIAFALNDKYHEEFERMQARY